MNFSTCIGTPTNATTKWVEEIELKGSWLMAIQLRMEWEHDLLQVGPGTFHFGGS